MPTRIPVACRSCWQCEQNKINDFVGRSLAENRFTDWTVALTLTYRDRDDMAHKLLTPMHFQKFMRAMRHHHKCRYLVAGEYGERKGRAHFHAILFGKGMAPQIPQKRMCSIPQWPHGHVFADWSRSESALRYVCKYLQKDMGQQSWFSMSKKPPLGSQWFAQRAKRMAALRVYPKSFTYRPPDAGPQHEFMLTGASRRDFLSTFCTAWEKHGPVELQKLSKWLVNACEQRELNRRLEEAEARPILDQIEDMLERLDADRLTERQLNRVFLDTYRDDDI